MRLRERGTAAEEELHLYAVQILCHWQGNPSIGSGGLVQIETLRTLVRIVAVQRGIRLRVAENTDTRRIIRTGRTNLIPSRRRLHVKYIRHLARRSDCHKRIAVRPFRTGRLDINIIRSVPAVVLLQRLAQITVAGNRSLIHYCFRSRVGRIFHLRVRNQHLIRRSIAFPRDGGIGVARINAYFGHFVDRWAVFDRHIINIEQVLSVKIAQECDIRAVSAVRTEVHDILLECLVAPYTHGINRPESGNIVRILHHTYYQASAVLASCIDIYGAPEMNLALVERKTLIGSIRQSR